MWIELTRSEWGAFEKEEPREIEEGESTLLIRSARCGSTKPEILLLWMQARAMTRLGGRAIPNLRRLRIQAASNLPAHPHTLRDGCPASSFSSLASTSVRLGPVGGTRGVGKRVGGEVGGLREFGGVMRGEGGGVGGDFESLNKVGVEGGTKEGDDRSEEHRAY